MASALNGKGGQAVHFLGLVVSGLLALFLAYSAYDLIAMFFGRQLFLVGFAMNVVFGVIGLATFRILLSDFRATRASQSRGDT